MAEPAQGLRWGVERRLEFIEFRLYWEGGINRGELTKFFGVSVPQASKDLSQYQDIAPGNMEYDKSEKRYFATTGFKPSLIDPSSDQYLSQLKAVADSGLRPEGNLACQCAGSRPHAYPATPRRPRSVAHDVKSYPRAQGYGSYISVDES